MPKSRYFFGKHWRAAAFESDPRTMMARTTSINDNTAVSSTTASIELCFIEQHVVRFGHIQTPVEMIRLK